MPNLVLSEEHLFLAEAALTGEDTYQLLTNLGFARALLELCSVVESLVLCDDVFMFIDSQNTPYNMTLFGKALQDNGILHDAYKLKWNPFPFMFAIGDPRRNEVEGFFRRAAAEAFLPWEHRSTEMEYMRRLLESDCRLEACFAETEILYKPLTWRLHVDVSHEAELRAIDSTLLNAYRQVMSQAEVTFARRVAYGYPLPILIPPIMAEVVRRTSSPESLVAAALEVRTEFAETRRYFSDLDAAFRNDRVSLAEFDRQWRSYEAWVSSLPGQDPNADRGRWALVRDVGGFLISSILKLGVDIEKLYEILSTSGAEQARSFARRRAGRYFTDLVSKWRRSKNWLRELERVCGRDISRSDAAIINHMRRLERDTQNRFSVVFGDPGRRQTDA